MAMSIAAPMMSMALRPISGSSTRPPSATPMIDPSVFQAYTAPIARSPAPPTISVRVMSGSVIPAQKVAGSMMRRQSTYRAIVKPV